MNLTDCKSEDERREHYPELCKLADQLSRYRHPDKVVAASLWIIRRRRFEERNAEKLKRDSMCFRKHSRGQ